MSRTVNLGDDLTAILEAQGEDLVEGSVKEAVVLYLYQRGVISSGKAGELLGMKRFDFVRYASDLGIPFYNYDPAELERELKLMENL